MNCPKRHTCWQSKRLCWEGASLGRAVGKGTQEDCSAMWLTALGFMMREFISRQSLANHCDSRPFLVVWVLLGQDGFQRGGFWEDVWTGVSFLLLTFPKFFWFVVAWPVPYQNCLVQNNSCRWLLEWAVSVMCPLTDSESALWAEISQKLVLACYLGVASNCDLYVS